MDGDSVPGRADFDEPESLPPSLDVEIIRSQILRTFDFASTVVHRSSQTGCTPEISAGRKTRQTKPVIVLFVRACGSVAMTIARYVPILC